MANFDKSFKSIAHQGGRIRRTQTGKFVSERSDSGRIRRSTFSSVEEAKQWLADLGARRNQHGTIATSLTGRQTQDALDAIHILKKAKVPASLVQLASAYVAGEIRKAMGETVEITFHKFLSEGARQGQRPRTLVDKKGRLASFIDLHGNRNLGEITRQDVDDWLSLTGASGRNLRNYKTAIQSFLNFAQKSVPQYQNEVANFPQDEKRDIEPAEILTPAEFEAVLREMERTSVRACLALALGCFAGLRTDEITGKSGLNWQDIDMESGQIIVPSGQSKTRRQRRVEITPNLKSWLTKYRKESGRITIRFNAYKKHRQSACIKVGIAWPANAARHSFATYYARLHGAHRAAESIGHTGGIGMFTEHYEGRPVALAEAENYFSIDPLPSEKAKLIQLQKSA